jgi:hypothetical protein
MCHKLSDLVGAAPRARYIDGGVAFEKLRESLRDLSGG